MKKLVQKLLVLVRLDKRHILSLVLSNRAQADKLEMSAKPNLCVSLSVSPFVLSLSAESFEA